MIEIEAIIQWLQGLPPLGVYAVLWFVCFIENVFPPSPSDLLMLFIATLIGFGTIDFLPAVGVATAGSVMGFIAAFYLGRNYGRRLMEWGKLPFLTPESLKKVDAWFGKYGYWVIIANRFLAGTRAVISFFAGMSNLRPLHTTVLCTISALAWNIGVIWLGSFLGSNWEHGRKILDNYGIAVTILLAVIIVVMVVRKLLQKRSQKNQPTTTPNREQPAEQPPAEQSGDQS
ncbi:MAG: DedA family protein [Chlorobi bacterium CHB2]|nr:DedA family protein [Chlorobi bacterium CHB2]